jgi:SPP1 family predicted phage head-tail adaptor
MTSAVYIRTGALKRKAELQVMTKTPDAGGGESVTWTKERDLWCQIRPLSGSKRLDAMAISSDVSHEIYARYAADITTAKRIVYAGVPYNIEAVIVPDQENEFVHLICKTGVPT